jgi:hypothetical protein
MNMRPAFCLSMAAMTLAVACDSGSQDPSPTSPAFSADASSKQATTAYAATGAVSGLSGTCPTVTFTVEGKTIKTSAATGYGDRTCADVKNDAKIGVMGTAQADGSILATQVRIAPPPPPPAVTATGAVSGLSGTCPAVAFTLEGKTIKTSAATGYGDRTCADVKNDAKVGVMGTAQADGSILATQVRIAPPPPPPAVTVTGTVSGLSGTCPTVTFTVEGKAIKTSAATGYGDRTCADVKNDAKIGVMGTAQADGSILATQVRIAPPATVPAIVGAITVLAGACPALTITVGTKTATTTSATVFDGKACADLKVGVEVGIFGAVPAGGSAFVATMVKSRK